MSSKKASLMNRALNEVREQVEGTWSVGKEHPRQWEQDVNCALEG